MTGAISQDRESCQFLFCLTKILPLYRSARPESGWEGALMEAARSNSERAASSASVGRRFSAPQVVWNRSNRSAGARGGARVGSAQTGLRNPVLCPCRASCRCHTIHTCINCLQAREVLPLRLERLSRSCSSFFS